MKIAKTQIKHFPKLTLETVETNAVIYVEIVYNIYLNKKCLFFLF